MIQPRGYQRRVPSYIDQLQRTTQIWTSDTALHTAWQSFSRCTFAHSSRSNGRRFSCHCEPSRPSQYGASCLDSNPTRSKLLRPVIALHSGFSYNRYGSSVPGPLEARRRARRRLMGRATPAMAQGGADPGVLMGINAKTIQRQRAKNQPGIFEWLGPIERASKGKEAQPSTTGRRDLDWSTSFPIAFLPNVSEILGRSNAAAGPIADNKPRSTRDVGGPVQESDVSPDVFTVDQHQVKTGHQGSQAKDSRKAFERLIHSQQPIDVLLNYLSNKSLNPTGANNVTFLLKSLAARNVAEFDSDLAKLEEWIGIETKLGTLDELEIRSILRAANASKRSLGDTWLSWTVFSRIWDGIDQSVVRSFDDLKQSTMMLLVRAAANAPEFNRGSAMGLKVLLALSRAKSKHAGDRTACLLAELTRKAYEDGDGTGFSACTTENIQQLVNILESLPEPVKSEAVVKLLSRLLLQTKSESGRSNTRGLESLHLWLVSLAKTNLLRDARKVPSTQRTWRNMDLIISVMGPRLLAAYLHHFNDQRTARFLMNDLLTRWHISHIAETSTTPVSMNEYPRLRSDFLHDLDHHALKLQELFKRPPHSPYLILTRTVRTKAPHLLNALLCTLLPLLRHQSKHASALAILDTLARANAFAPLRLLFSEIAHLAPTDPHLALILWTTDPRPQMADCPVLPTLLSADRTIDPTLLRRVYFRLRVAHRLPRSPQQPVRRPLNPASALVLELLAHHLAVCPTLSHRQALRAVRRVLMLFRRNAEMLTPGVARAVTKAGILRPLQAGRRVGIARKRWVGSWVVGLEGERIWGGVEGVAASWEAKIEQRILAGTGGLKSKGE